MFFDRYSELCKKVGKTPTGVALELNVSRATVNYWKNGNVPKQEILTKIADYFKVTVDYLLGNKTNTSTKDLVKFALFDGDVDVTDEMYNEVKEFAEYIKIKYKKDNETLKSSPARTMKIAAYGGGVMDHIITATDQEIREAIEESDDDQFVIKRKQ